MSENIKEDDAKRGKKILILGLDKAGKTSIVLSLKGKTNLLSFYRLDPTIGLQRDIFRLANSDFFIWDFGGQEQFRGNYLKNFDNHIIGSSKLIYVIDIQDNARYDLALEYFQNIIDFIKDRDDIDLSIFLHKFDPDLYELCPDLNDEKVNNLIQKIKGIVPKNLFYNMFKTTIYTIFEKTIID